MQGLLGDAAFPGDAGLPGGCVVPSSQRPAPRHVSSHLGPRAPVGSHTDHSLGSRLDVPWEQCHAAGGCERVCLCVCTRVRVCARMCVCVHLPARAKAPAWCAVRVPRPGRVCVRAAHVCTVWVCGVWMHTACVCAYARAVHVLCTCPRVPRAVHACAVSALCTRSPTAPSAPLGGWGGHNPALQEGSGGGHGGHAMLASHTHTHIPPPHPSLLPRQQGEPGASLGTGYHQPLPPRCGGPGCPQGGWRWPGGGRASVTPQPHGSTRLHRLWDSTQHRPGLWGAPKLRGQRCSGTTAQTPPAAGHCLARWVCGSLAITAALLTLPPARATRGWVPGVWHCRRRHVRTPLPAWL